MRETRKPQRVRRTRRVVKRLDDHENLERWLVSYADFITLLFAFFVVMYAISQVNEGKYKVLSESIVNAFQNVPRSQAPIPLGHENNRPGPVPAIAPSLLPPTPEQQQILRRRERQQAQLRRVSDDLTTAVQPLINQGQVRMSQDERGILVEISASVLFKSGQALLEPEAVPVLISVGRVLAAIPNPIQVEGHTDNVPIGTTVFPTNWELSAARAASVVRLFIDQGVSGARLTAAGFGEFRPIADNQTPEGRGSNRRVTVIIQNQQN